MEEEAAKEGVGFEEGDFGCLSVLLSSPKREEKGELEFEGGLSPLPELEVEKRWWRSRRGF